MRTEVLNHFKKFDNVIYEIITKYSIELPTRTATSSLYNSLTKTIIYQQLSGKAADTIHRRFINKLGVSKYSPKDVLTLSIEELRSVGLSNSKANYIHNIATEVVEKRLDFKRITDMSDNEIIQILSKIKGVGRWTAEMFLLFDLSRENIFSINDLGLHKGITKLYGYKKLPSIKTISRIVKKWDPYKSYGTLALWKFIDDKS